MEPEIAPICGRDKPRSGQSRWCGVVREGIVNATAVNVHVLAQVLDGDARAFNMPAGIASPQETPI